MKLIDLANYINQRLKQHSLAVVKVIEGFWEDRIKIDSDAGDAFVLITKNGKWICCSYKEFGKTMARLEVVSDPFFLGEVVDFVNNHTLHHNPENDGYEEDDDETDE